MFEWFREPGRKLPKQQELPEEAFADEAMVERLLAEIEEALKDPAKMCFPGLMACSYCWLHPDHPDPDARTMRERWLPVFEWYFSERVHRNGKVDSDKRTGRNRYTWSFEGSEAELLERSDFGVFIDYGSMCQRNAEGTRSDTDEKFFMHALHSLDIIFAHIG